MIPTDGSTIMIWVDSLPVGRPSYNHYRVDIATLFPGYANSNGAVGVYYLDTTAYANGTHTIEWSVRDNAGNEDGVGSRYFNIVNTGTSSPAGGAPVGEPAYPYIGRGRPLAVFSRMGYDLDAPFTAVAPNARLEKVVQVGELGRVEIRCGEGDETGGAKYRAFQVVGEELRALPIGASFDPRSGTLAWQIGPGFLGSFRFLLMKGDEHGLAESALVEVRIVPGATRR